MLHLQAYWKHLIDLIADRALVPLLDFVQIPPASVDVREVAASLLITALHLMMIAFVFRPFESWLPVERWADRRATRVDRQYTLLMLLGLLPLSMFLAMTPLRGVFGGEAANGGLLRGISAFDQHPYLRWAAYYIAFDFVYYWMHRAEHAIPWWWALHSLHHSQRQVSCWTNDRDSFLAGLLEAAILASVGIALGVEPSEFALLMLAGELIQNFSHANVRVGFGRVVAKLIVGPAFHRLHHMRVDATRPGLHNCNFAQAFPLWDIVFGTALYGEAPHPCGVTDPVVDADNERGLVGQQLCALRRFLGAVRRREGWRLGEVSFGSDYQPVPNGRLATRKCNVGS